MSAKKAVTLLIQHHLICKKQLNEFSKEELNFFPLEYLIEHAHPIELLTWSKLISNYMQN